MDERLSKALDFSNYMVTLNNQKRVIKEQYEQDLIFYYNGGQFTLTQEFISFCHTLISLDQSTAILTDDNSTPIEVNDLANFTIDVTSQYFEASNKYHAEYVKLKTTRSVEGIVKV
jgi:hypothetical protein|tara:strand:+ start:4777 stop:5124 length:348 start_codon:yes stop_codon:yes gene_type:complete